jgi:hypothetical protein
MFVVGDNIQVRTTTATGDEFWEDGAIREVDGDIIWVDLETPVSVSTKGGKRDIVTVPIAAEDVRSAPDEVLPYEPEPDPPLPPAPTVPRMDGASSPGRMTRREQAAADAAAEFLRPNGCAINLLIVSIIFFIALVIGCIIGIAFT